VCSNAKRVSCFIVGVPTDLQAFLLIITSFTLLFGPLRPGRLVVSGHETLPHGSSQ
jgi:hypothetical protein